MMLWFIWIVLLTYGLGSLGTLGNGNQFYYQELPIPGPAHRYKNKQKRESSSFYKVDALIIVDFSLNLRLRNIFSEYFLNVYDSNAIIRNTYMFLIERVNGRFSLLDDSKFMIRIAVTDIYIADSLANTPWSSTIQYTSEIGATKALEELNSWLRASSQVTVPKNITVIALTAMKLLDNSNRAVQGISQNGSICSGSNVIILQETFDFILVTVATHYIARSMGAHEDGKENNCSADNHFIMSTPNMAITGETKSNPWRFSECSTREIKNFISSLSNACFARLTNVTGVQINFSGTSLTVDQQCKIIKGTSSYMCRIPLGGKYEEMCTGMYCYNATNNMCDLVVPREGTLCGNGKWCINGVCVSSFTAPSANANCAYGDQPVIEFSTAGCSSYISSASSECYNVNVSLACCYTCLTQVSVTKDCPYGNRISSCTIRHRDCYNASINSDCCKTCYYYETAFPDCLYGDRIGSCGSIPAMDCYNATINVNCCDTCRSRYTFYEDCEYGDKVAWCASISGRDCYNESTSKNCCGTCNKLINYFPEDCAYGDRVDWCNSISSRDCYNATTNRACCKSCSSYSTFIPDCEYGNRIAFCDSVLGMDCYNDAINRNCCQTCLSFRTFYFNCLYGDYVSGCRLSECSSYSMDKLKKCCGTCGTNFQRTSPAAIIATVPTTNKFLDSHETATAATSNDGWVGPVVGTIVGVVIAVVSIISVLYYLRRRQRLKKTQQVHQQQQLKEMTRNGLPMTPIRDFQSDKPPIPPPRDSQGSWVSHEGDAEETYAYIYPNDIENASGTATNTSVEYDTGYSTNGNANEYLEPVGSKQYSAYFGYVEVIGTGGAGKDEGYLNLRTEVDATCVR
ncbi:hypothetical protein CHS0354_000395 [Potamilus streckersoni]|uniref:Peptidase M12B domain-containing protein n=1 Tax=Potamilus streckersoni TaxID=2493646 RepID=A0AAE0VZ58_9BIVA|nr:hypothetical protein CHS0354_000395 [Potamilus streckersoni]